MQAQLRTRLLNDATVSALVSNRVDWGIRPQGDDYPSVVLTLAADERPQTFTGLIEARETLVQIDCYGRSSAEVLALREAVIACITPGATVGAVTFDRAFINTVRTMNTHSETGKIYRDSIDARVWHRS